MDKVIPIECNLLKDINVDMIKPIPFQVKESNKVYFMKYIPILSDSIKINKDTILDKYIHCNEYYIHNKILNELGLIHVPKLLTNKCKIIHNNDINILIKKSNGGKRISKTLIDVKKTINEYTKYGDTQNYCVVYANEWINDSIDIDTMSEVIPKLSVTDDVKDDIWRNLVFQVVYSLYILQKKYKFMHNDFHTNNMLIDEIPVGGYIKYSFNDNDYYLPNIGYLVKITDFEWSTIEETNHRNGYYEDPIFEGFSDSNDLYLFIACLLDLEISKELRDMIMSIYPAEVFNCEENEEYFINQRFNKKGYNHYKDVLVSPEKMLQHPYFDKLKKRTYVYPHIADV